MTIEEINAALAAAGWRVWSVGDLPHGGWSCTLYTDRPHDAVQDKDGRRMGGLRGGFSRRGQGAGMADAMMDAARDIIQPEEENDVDLAFILG